MAATNEESLMDGADTNETTTATGILGAELPPFVEFEPPPHLYYLKTPRFGYRDDFPSVLNAQTRQDYLIGLSLVGVVVVGAFLVWAILLMVFCCLGRKVGWLSGRQFESVIGYRSGKGGVVVAEQVVDYDTTAWRQEYQSIQERKTRASKFKCHGCCGGTPTRCRVVFLMAGIVFVAATILMVTHGIANLRTSLATLQGPMMRVNDIAETAYVLLEDTKVRVGGVADQLRIVLQSQLQPEQFCPANPSSSDTVDAATIQQIQTEASKVVGQLEQVRFFIDDTAEKLTKTLLQARDQTRAVVQWITSTTSATADWRVMISIIPSLVFAFLLMSGVALALWEVEFKWLNAMLDWFILPLFILLVITCWVVAGGMLMAGGVTGDFCLPGGRVSSPDTTIRQAMEALGLSQQQVFFIVDYYVRQCRDIRDPFLFIKEEIPKLEQNEEAATQLLGVLEGGNLISQLSLYCNRDFGEFQIFAGNVINVIGVLLDAARLALNLISCSTIVPLYTSLAYDGLCYYSASAVLWVFGCSLVMGVTGMIMIMLRSSWHATKFFVKDAEVLNSLLYPPPPPPPPTQASPYSRRDLDEMEDDEDSAEIIFDNPQHSSSRHHHYDDDDYPMNHRANDSGRRQGSQSSFR